MARGLRRRCPFCGRGRLFTGWFKMVGSCPECGLEPERVEGQWLGAIALNTVLTQVVLFGYFGVFAGLTWPDVPWGWLTVSAMTLAVSFPVFFHPYSRALWLAVDIRLRPVPNNEQELIAVAGYLDRVAGGGRTPSASG